MGIDGADSASKTSINRANRKRKGKGLEDKKGKEKVREPTTKYDKKISELVCPHRGSTAATYVFHPLPTMQQKGVYACGSKRCF